MRTLTPRVLSGAALMLAGIAVAAGASNTKAEDLAGRPALVHVPARLPDADAGKRALVVVLHGGLGNAERIEGRTAEWGLNLDAEADRHGFVVAYLNGTRAGRWLPERIRAWNAGSCCGLPQKTGVDDQGYIRHATSELAQRHAIQPGRVYAAGHSNGAMMAQAMACQTDVFAAIVAISGPLTLPIEHCPSAQGRRILALHGAEDENVPVAGGVGRRGISRVDYPAEAHSKEIMETSGARYDLEVLPGAGHFLTSIETTLQRTQGITLQTKIVQFFGLD